MAGITERVRKGLGEPVQSTSQDVFQSLRQKSSASVILGKRTYSQLNNTKEEGERPSTQELGFGTLRLGDKIRRTSPFIPDKPSTSIEQSGGENAMKVGPLARNTQRGNKDIRHTLRDNAYTDHQLLDYTGGEEMRRNQMDPAKVDPIIPAETEESQQQERVHNVLQRAQVYLNSSIRKKNIRFDIPEGRNLGNIDHLIAQTTDERQIKELKQQKRLLRNRQAALDSRQRKKLQTERLEDEKKQYTVLISDMEEEMSQLSRRNEQLLLEKEEMIRSHTKETGELRKNIAILIEHAQRSQDAIPRSTSHLNPNKTGKSKRLGSKIL
ncbi:hypothetical protein HG530_014702 [Fusarium avenaceum]|nr:hypothetical protein HG530_014702 [Fusarium avenaceum]